MWSSVTSLPAGKATCLPCRRIKHGLAPDQHVTTPPETRVAKTCARCGTTFTGKKSRRYCSVECGKVARQSSAKGNTTKRGYGAKHQRLRETTIADAIDTPCHFCGEPMLVGQPLHLDHTEDRSAYRGFAHAQCNRRDGALRGNERKRQIKLYRAGMIDELPMHAVARKPAPPPPKRIPKVKPTRWQDRPHVCASCEQTFIPTHARQVHCTAECKQEMQRTAARERYRHSGAWQGATWSAHRIDNAPPRTCVRCGITYSATGARQQWCSRKCRNDDTKAVPIIRVILRKPIADPAIVFLPSL